MFKLIILILVSITSQIAIAAPLPSSLFYKTTGACQYNNLSFYTLMFQQKNPTDKTAIDSYVNLKRDGSVSIFFHRYRVVLNSYGHETYESIDKKLATTSFKILEWDNSPYPFKWYRLKIKKLGTLHFMLDNMDPELLANSQIAVEKNSLYKLLRINDQGRAYFLHDNFPSPWDDQGRTVKEVCSHQN